MRIGLAVVDDGLYTHRWVRGLVETGEHEICAGVCLNPFSAPNFNPSRSSIGSMIARTRYYGPAESLKFGGRYLRERTKDGIFRLTKRGRAGSVRSLLVEAGIPILPVPDRDLNNLVFQADLKVHQPEVIVCAVSQGIGSRLRGLARHGCLNVHFSCLPENAGREPVFWSLLRGRGFGLTVYRMGAGFDSGDLLAQGSLSLDGLGTLDEAIRLVCDNVPETLLEALDNLKTGSARRLAKPEHNPWPRRKDVKAFRQAGFSFI